MTEADAPKAGYRAAAAGAPKKKLNQWIYARRVRGRRGFDFLALSFRAG
jgi:hypothetical protein